MPPCVRRASPLLLYVSPHLCCTIIQTQSCLRGKNCWICRDERSRGDAHREPKSLHFFFSVFHSFKPQRSRTRQSTKRKRQRDTSFTKALRAPSRLHKIPLSGMGVGTAHTGVSGGKKKGQDSTSKAQFLERYVVHCTASSCVYASSYLSSVFCFFFFFFLLYAASVIVFRQRIERAYGPC